MSEPALSKPFIHLRLHTEFSISDGLVTIPALINSLQQLHMPAVAITDVSNLFGLIKFYSGAAKSGIKPICGVDVLVENEEGVRSRIVLLVKNRTGYLNLTNIISKLYTDSETHGEPVLAIDSFSGVLEGLIALSGAQHGDIGSALLGCLLYTSDAADE